MSERARLVVVNLVVLLVRSGVVRGQLVPIVRVVHVVLVRAGLLFPVPYTVARVVDVVVHIARRAALVHHHAVVGVHVVVYVVVEDTRLQLVFDDRLLRRVLLAHYFRHLHAQISKLLCDVVIIAAVGAEAHIQHTFDGRLTHRKSVKEVDRGS